MPLCAGHRLQPSGAGRQDGPTLGSLTELTLTPWILDLAPKASRGEASAVLSLLPGVDTTGNDDLGSG